MDCGCYQEGDSVGEFTILQSDPVEIAVSKDKKHVWVNDAVAWCGIGQ